MATFEDIQKANEQIKTIGIERKDKKGKTTIKEYAEVNQRIKAFRMVYPEGAIKTEMISNENGVCVFKAEVYSEYTTEEPFFVKPSYMNLLATGWSYEKENSTFINRTSYIENCETSAIGRALGIAGFGIDTSVASAEEVMNAEINQVLQAPATDKDKESLKNELVKKGKKWDELETLKDLKPGDTLTFELYNKAMQELKAE